jgi:excisionase family DNA binding protein
VTTTTTFLTVPEIAKQLRVWPETVRHWLHRGELEGVKLPGGDWRIRAVDLDAMLQGRKGS